MTVLDFTSIAAQRQAAIAKHPAGRLLADLDRARSLTAIAREWDHLISELSHGPDSLNEDEAEATLRVMASALVHRDAIASLVFTLPTLVLAVKQRDDVRDGTTHPLDIDCMSHAEAMADSDDAIDHALYPLIHGRPTRDACRGCRRTCASVNHWQTQVDCDRHRERRV